MRASILTLNILLGFGLMIACAGQVDPRFDGLWAGVESIQGYFVQNQLGGGQTPGRVSAMIAIADSGKRIGFTQGLIPANYDVSPKSDGNTLIYKLEDLHPGGVRFFYGRTDGKLMLSADGNTLTETAHAKLPARGGRGFADCIITGTFRRQAKK